MSSACRRPQSFWTKRSRRKSRPTSFSPSLPNQRSTKRLRDWKERAAEADSRSSPSAAATQQLALRPNPDNCSASSLTFRFRVGTAAECFGEGHEKDLDIRGYSSDRRERRIRGCSGKAAAQDQSPAAQETQKDRDPRPGTENMNRRAERAQTAARTSESQGQKPPSPRWPQESASLAQTKLLKSARTMLSSSRDIRGVILLARANLGVAHSSYNLCVGFLGHLKMLHQDRHARDAKVFSGASCPEPISYSNSCTACW
jgi:hypothetical protein